MALENSIAALNAYKVIDLTCDNSYCQDDPVAYTLDLRTHYSNHVIAFENWSSRELLAGLLASPRAISYIPRGNPTPYDKVRVEFNKGRRHWIIGTDTLTNTSYLHCEMTFGHGFIAKL